MFPFVLTLVAGASLNYQWQPVSNVNQVALYHRGKQIGNYDFKRDLYRPYDARCGCWGKPCQPPVAPPKGKNIRNFGLERDKLQGAERYRHNGKDVSRRQVQEILAASVPDDASRLRLTVIGTEAERRQVADDLAKNPALAGWRDRLSIQAYAPEHWAVARVGFVTGGKPTIYLQSPDGVVLHRQDDYDGGAPALAEALRKADPTYRSERDRDLRVLGPISRLPRLPWSAFVLAAGAAGVFLLPRRKP